jgi:hypothetical protein
MKRILLIAAAGLFAANTVAQSPFLAKTCYRGAFAPAPTPMWTEGWTEWDPQNKNYPAPTLTVTGNITSNTTWATGQTVLLSAQCFVQNAVLTIQPGVTILGDKSVTGAGIFVTKGSKLIANGTVSQPIVFTSNQAPGQRSLGDWGGIILLGKASSNNPNGVGNIEGLPTSGDTEYGGGSSPDDNDNSGSLQYVRIEFPGYVYQPDKEINGLTFGCVGKGTTIDHVQVSFSNDDAFEWFGGSVNCKHLVAYRCLDDNFDTDYGYHGTVQFCLGVRDPNFADNPNVSTSEGFESDNDPTGTQAMPVTSAIFSNVTDIGPLRGVATATAANGFRRGARIRRNSALKIVNSLFLDHKTRGLYIDGTLAENNAAGTTTNTLLFKNNILANYGQKATETQTASTAFNATLTTWLKINGNDTLPFIGGSTSNSILVNPYNYLTPDYRPFAGSIAASGASFSDALIAAQTSSSSPVVAAGVPSTSCLGNNPSALTPYTFVGSTTISPGYCSLMWSVAPGVTISSTADTNPSFTISTLGTFTINLDVTNENGTSSVPLTVVTSTCVDVGINKLAAPLNEIKVYPSPSDGEVNISFNSSETNPMIISITDLTGKKVEEFQFNPIEGNNTAHLSTLNLENGIYFVRFDTVSGKETVKLVVQH